MQENTVVDSTITQPLSPTALQTDAKRRVSQLTEGIKKSCNPELLQKWDWTNYKVEPIQAGTNQYRIVFKPKVSTDPEFHYTSRGAVAGKCAENVAGCYAKGKPSFTLGFYEPKTDYRDKFHQRFAAFSLGDSDRWKILISDLKHEYDHATKAVTEGLANYDQISALEKCAVLPRSATVDERKALTLKKILNQTGPKKLSSYTAAVLELYPPLPDGTVSPMARKWLLPNGELGRAAVAEVVKNKIEREGSTPAAVKINTEGAQQLLDSSSPIHSKALYAGFAIYAAAKFTQSRAKENNTTTTKVEMEIDTWARGVRNESSRKYLTTVGPQARKFVASLGFQPPILSSTASR